jgi:hypothetical protein
VEALGKGLLVSLAESPNCSQGNTPGGVVS